MPAKLPVKQRRGRSVEDNDMTRLTRSRYRPIGAAFAILIALCAILAACEGDQIYQESYPWPSEPVDAVRRAILGIEGRNWNLYATAFEPTSVLSPTFPGIPGQFYTLQFEELARDDKQAIIRVTGKWEPSGSSMESGQAYLDAEITVVRAKKPLGGRIAVLEGVQAEASVYSEGWYIRYDQAGRIPFNLNALTNLIPYHLRDISGSFAVVRNGDIWLQNASHQDEQLQLTTGDAQDDTPGWSPDYHKVTFFRAEKDAKGNPITRYCTIDPQGSRLACTPDSLGDIENVSWPPKGDQFLVYNWQEDTGCWVKRLRFLANADLDHITAPPDPLLTASLSPQPWSPDGRSILLALPDGVVALYHVERSAFERLAYSSLQCPQPQWAADGDIVIYTGTCTTQEVQLITGLQPAGQATCLRAVTVDGSSDYPLVVGRSFHTSQAPHGPWILTVAETHSGNKSLLLINTITREVLSGAQHGLSTLGTEYWCAEPPQALWSPNGAVLLTFEQPSEQPTLLRLTYPQPRAASETITTPWDIDWLVGCTPFVWSSDGGLALIDARFSTRIRYGTAHQALVLNVGTLTWSELYTVDSERDVGWIPNTHWTYSIRSRKVAPPADQPDALEVSTPEIFLKNADTGQWRWVTWNDVDDSDPIWGSYE